MSAGDLERRLRVLEDVEEIKRLKVRYCHSVDAYDAEWTTSLFTDDGVFDFVGRDPTEGREALLEFYKKGRERLPFYVHMVMNPVIEVDGATATGIWYLFEPCTLGDTGRAVWGSGRYDDEYVKVDGQWRFKNVKLSIFFWTPFDEGWVKTRSVW